MSRQTKKLQPPLDTSGLLSLDFVEGMARVRGYDVFRFDDDAALCFHCNGRRMCNCAGCIEFTDQFREARWRIAPTVCGACKGAGLLTWPPEEIF